MHGILIETQYSIQIHMRSTPYMHVYHSSSLKVWRWLNTTTTTTKLNESQWQWYVIIQFVHTVPDIISFLLLVNVVVFWNIRVDWYCVFVQLLPHQWCQWQVSEMVRSYCYHNYLTEESVIVCPKEYHKIMA